MNAGQRCEPEHVAECRRRSCASSSATPEFDRARHRGRLRREARPRSIGPIAAGRGRRAGSRPTTRALEGRELGVLRRDAGVLGARAPWNSRAVRRVVHVARSDAGCPYPRSRPRLRLERSRLGTGLGVLTALSDAIRRPCGSDSRRTTRRRRASRCDHWDVPMHRDRDRTGSVHRRRNRRRSARRQLMTLTTVVALIVGAAAYVGTGWFAALQIRRRRSA